MPRVTRLSELLQGRIQRPASRRLTFLIRALRVLTIRARQCPVWDHLAQDRSRASAFLRTLHSQAHQEAPRLSLIPQHPARNEILRPIQPQLNKDKGTMSVSNMSRRIYRPVRAEGATHLYAVGQAVWLKDGFGPRSQASGVYHITGTLPPKGAFPQYRIRSEEERHERVTTQDNLEPVHAVTDGENSNLIEKTFRNE